MKTEVAGLGGVRIALRVEGAENTRPIVFVHGWAQSGAAWSAQLADPALSTRFRLVAMDLRGHGASDVPAVGYDDPRQWAEDLAAVLDFAGPDAILVGWSYGGLVIADYLRVHGSARLSGIVLAGAITEIGRGREGGRTGPIMRAALPAALSEDAEVAVPALVEFARAQANPRVPGTYAQAMLGQSLAVPPSVRGALFRRDIGSAEVLAAVDKPVLVVHGTADGVVSPAAAEYSAGKIPGAVLRWFVDAGHLPFVEEPGEFNSLLRQFSGETAEEQE
ncbi:alpha/beta fold hydrolase [Amycolatopsis jiangsuensis]|uniref:Pimeloyl-ACP methyl ester carboxylesterase n=1 Tax=Amycolatopsis jiangsuensis TaxID=1181879 RepID=A0A840IY56_9PSEU|nr:alpha/beta hydrolase [Amycolatopsis jiangsuensis]MBB4686633.1 pimeloyl-ACP methyl ester carboxylesterase [Amycolatopsis jiangsuensis]